MSTKHTSLLVSVKTAVVAAFPAVAPDEDLCGLSLLLRAVLRLGRCGIERVIVVGRAGAPLSDPRITAVVTESPGSSWADVFRVAEQQNEPVVVTSAEVVAQPRVFDKLIRDETAHDVVLAHRNGPLRLTPVGAKTLHARAKSQSGDSLEALLDGIDAQRLEAPGWIHVVRGEGRERAFRDLFEDCRKDVDGLVSRHLNRHVSLFVSKRLVNLAVTPNQISFVTFLFGAAGALFVAQASYWSMLIGAFLFQLNSILDGVDGELARVRFQQSRLGEWVDTIGDDVSNLMFYGALAFAATAHPAPGPLFAWLGYAGVALGALTMVLYYSELVRVGSGDFYALGLGTGAKNKRPGALAPVVTLVGYLTKKDFFIFGFLVAAMFNVLIYALPVIFVGTAATFLAGLSLKVRRLKKD